jgi:hypothetical protein
LTKKKSIKFYAKNEKCEKCQKPLSLPTIHFMCGHSYHARCIPPIKGENRSCFTCTNTNEEMKRVLDTVQKDAAEAADSDKFYKRLNKNQNKFNTIAQYLERGMIKDFQPEERND